MSRWLLEVIIQKGLPGQAIVCILELHNTILYLIYMLYTWFRDRNKVKAVVSSDTGIIVQGRGLYGIKWKPRWDSICIRGSLVWTDHILNAAETHLLADTDGIPEPDEAITKCLHSKGALTIWSLLLPIEMVVIGAVKVKGLQASCQASEELETGLRRALRKNVRERLMMQ